MDKKILIPIIIGAFFITLIFSSGCTMEDSGTNDEESEPETYRVCSDGECIKVQGEGEDRCENDADCVSTIKTHMICRADEKCVEVEGEGEDECDSDDDCLNELIICREKCIEAKMGGHSAWSSSYYCTGEFEGINCWEDPINVKCTLTMTDAYGYGITCDETMCESGCPGTCCIGADANNPRDCDDLGGNWEQNSEC